jgi:phenylpropionate dioxygenase-like ring-hydroxylating dioxygenase large terminal subunit
MTIQESAPVGARGGDGTRRVGPNPLQVQAAVPYAMDDSYYVPKERYFDREYFDLEKRYMWPRAWQMAARLDEIPNAGDYVVYEIVGNSIVIVRQDDGSVKALHNACRHRATELAVGCGHLAGGQIVCPFHGWRWNLDGSSSFVFLGEEFNPEYLKPDDLSLRECLVKEWAGMVWINLDVNARPFEEDYADLIDLIDALGVENMHPKWWKQVVLDANWKLTMEAFHEGYHGWQTHPQLLTERMSFELASKIIRDMEFLLLHGGHGRYFGKYFDPSEYNFTGDDFIESNRLLAEGQDSMVLEGDVEIFEQLKAEIGVDDPEFAQKAIAALYEHAEREDIPMPPLSEYMHQWGGVIYLFPNYFILPQYGNALVYRMRPIENDPERVLFDLWSLTSYPRGNEPERTVLEAVYDKNDKENWGLIPRQDFSNIERQQRGLHSQSFEKMRLSPKQESTIVHFHQELDRVIAEGKTQRG